MQVLFANGVGLQDDPGCQQLLRKSCAYPGGGHQASGGTSKVFLVQLPSPVNTMRGPIHDLPSLLTDAQTTATGGSVYGTRQAFLWAEILSEVTVVKNTPIDRIPALADALGAQLVVFTTRAVGLIRFRTGNGAETDLFASLAVPILIFNAPIDMNAWNGREFRKILLPTTFEPDLGFQLRFACRFARRYHGRVTVLHVFENHGANEQYWDRTAVEAKLPISELKHEGILCPMEIAVCEGYPARQILSFQERKAHDLIIIGGRRQVTSGRGLGHGVAEAVIAEARCPVLILGGAIEGIPASMESDSKLSLA